MKGLVCLFLLSALHFPLFPQNNKDIIASAGGNSSVADISIRWILGETLVPKYKSSDLILSQGFQLQQEAAHIGANSDNAVKVRLFPNPSDGKIMVSFSSPVESEVSLSFINSHGRTVMTGFIERAVSGRQISLRDLPAGIYYLKLTMDKSINIYKVVKL